MLLKLRFRVNSNPTLSAILFKIKELLESQDPLSGSFFFFGMSDMQFARPRCVPLRLKPTDWESVFEHPHLNYGYAVTSHSSQGQTADRVLSFFSFSVVYLYYVPCPEILFVSPSRNAYDRRL